MTPTKRFTISSGSAPVGRSRHRDWQAAQDTSPHPVVVISVNLEDAALGYQVGRVNGRGERKLEERVCYDPMFRYRIGSQPVTIIAVSAKTGTDIDMMILNGSTDSADGTYADTRIFG